MEIQEITLYIRGMHCAGCVKRVQDALKGAPGVQDASVSYGESIAKVRGTGLSVPVLCRHVQQAGYEASERPFSKSSLSLLWPLAAIAVLYGLLEHFGLLNRLVPSQLSDGSMGYGALFLVGLMTSVHCIAMCGGIGLSQSVAGVRQSASRWKPTVLYNLGRLLSYTLIGAALGSVGLLLSDLSLTVSYTLQGFVKLLAGFVMVIMGLHMLGLLPALPLFHGKLPIPKKLLSPFGIGLINGLMPCGPLQSMFLLALASGSPLRGGLCMAFFGLGTLPLMLGFGSLVGLLGQKFTGTVLLFGSILICVLGLGMASQGGALADLFTAQQLLAAVLLLFGLLAVRQWRQLRAVLLPIGAACFLAASIVLFLYRPASQGTAARLGDDGYQTVTTRLDPGAYPDIQVAAGIPVRWIVQAQEEDINGCNNRILCRSFGLEYTFHPGENVIEFTPEAPGTYPYSCWMGMITGTITVTQ